MSGFDFFGKKTYNKHFHVILFCQKQFIKENFNVGEHCKIGKMNIQVYFNNCMYRKVIFIGRYKKFDSTLSTQGHHYNRVSIKQEYTLLEYPSQDSILYRIVSITE